MPPLLTEVTELATALGMLVAEPQDGLRERPPALSHVGDDAWGRLVNAFEARSFASQFDTAFANGVAMLHAQDGLRGRSPMLVEWRGPHRVPGDDVIPADLRIDHVYLVSCKYLSRILQNAGPVRLFDRLLTGESRAGTDWFFEVAPAEYQFFYEAAAAHAGQLLPTRVQDLAVDERRVLREALRARQLPLEMQASWTALCAAVADTTAARWGESLSTTRLKLRMLWRLLRIGDASYFVLGADQVDSVRLRVASAWDWMQMYELISFEVTPRPAGQPEIAWRAVVRDRVAQFERSVEGHVEVRWSHGRFMGAPEAKIYLDTPHANVPGYFALF